MDKKTLRTNMIKQMKSFVGEAKHTADLHLATQLYQSITYQSAQRIGIVLAMSHEVDTYQIIKHMLNDGKEVFVPHTDYENRVMTFKEINDLSQIGKDDKGINYITADTTITNELNLVIVPGVVFNDQGYRIGYGGGYFDKFLSQHEQQTLSLIYDFQLNDFEPESHDQPVETYIVATTK